MGKFGVIIYYWVFILGALLVMYVLGIADNNSLVITLLVAITAVYAVAVGSYKIALRKKEEKSRKQEQSKGNKRKKK